VTGLLTGARDFARGARFLAAHPRLGWWIAAPALLTVVVLAGAVWAGTAVAAHLAAIAASLVPGWLAWMAGPVTWLVGVAAAVGLTTLGFLVYVSVAGLLAGPFCELLSEAVEEIATGARPSRFSIVAFAHGALLGLAHALRRLAVYLLALAALFAAGALVPGVGAALAAAGGVYLAAATAAYDCYDAVFGRRLWRYRRKRAFLAAHRARSLGLGGAVAFFLAVPLVNLVALAIGSIGATLAVLDLESRPRG
jgi:CysZ protein